MRYIYLALPVLFSINIDAIFFILERKYLKTIVAIFVLTLAFVTCGVRLNQQCLRVLSNKFLRCQKLLINIARNKDYQDKDILILGLPQEIVPQSGVAQAIKLFGFKGKVFCPKICCAQYSSQNNPFQDNPEKNLIEITKAFSGITLKSSDPEKCWILLKDSNSKSLSDQGDGLEIKQVEWIDNWRAKKITIEFSDKIVTKPTLVELDF